MTDHNLTKLSFQAFSSFLSIFFPFVCLPPLLPSPPLPLLYFLLLHWMACCAVAPPSDLQPSLERVRSASANCLTPVSHVPSPETQRYSLTSLTPLTPITSHPPCHLRPWCSVTLVENKPPLLTTNHCGAPLLKAWWFQPPTASLHTWADERWYFLYRTVAERCKPGLQNVKHFYKVWKNFLTTYNKFSLPQHIYNSQNTFTWQKTF